jgi:glutaredoxin
MRAALSLQRPHRSDGEAIISGGSALAGAHGQLPNVILYSKPDCPLCDEARGALGRVRDRTPFELTEVDITVDPQLEAAYRERIPVITLDGLELFDYHVDELVLEQRLAEVAAA